MDVPVASLPRLIRVEADRLVCGACRRAWRKPEDEMLSLANFNYLCEHALDHTRRQAGRPRNLNLSNLGSFQDGL